MDGLWKAGEGEDSRHQPVRELGGILAAKGHSERTSREGVHDQKEVPVSFRRRWENATLGAADEIHNKDLARLGKQHGLGEASKQRARLLSALTIQTAAGPIANVKTHVRPVKPSANLLDNGARSPTTKQAVHDVEDTGSHAAGDTHSLDSRAGGVTEHNKVIFDGIHAKTRIIRS